LRDIFEALAAYLANTGLSSNLNRGQIDQAHNRQLIAVLERPSLAGWVNALRGLAAWLGDDPRFGWWHDVARLLDRRCEISQGADVARVLNSHVSGEAGAEPVNLLGWFALLADFHSLWLLPERFAEAESRELIAGLRPLLEQVVAALAVLADVELAVVQDVSVTAAGDYSVGLGTLSGQNFGQERTEAAAPPTRNELYLVARGTRELLLPVGPLMLCDCGEASSVVPHAVCTLLRWPDERRALYLSRASGHQRWIDDADVLARLRNLLLQLDPGGKRFSHLLRAVAVGLYDLSGYTTLTREHGPAVAREMVRRMVSAVREAAQVHGGYVGPVVGDEVLVYFDQPQPAVLAATDAMHTLLELNRRNPTAIHMHVGMDYGPGVVEKNDVWGDVINRAKRCQSLAGPGEIVISADMAGAIGDHDRFQLVAAQGNLKGFGEAEVFRVDYGGSQSS
ncbi:MAG: adenylate/guanylate cyclase domain-containing protein, partial [Pirellulales bacterium]